MKSVLIVEPNPYHGITLPGMTEYFQQLGYKVTILMRPELAKDKPLQIYPKHKMPLILVKTPDEIKKILASDYASKFSYIFINSSAYWEPGVYQNSYLKYLNFIPEPKITTLFLEHNLDYLEEDDCLIFFKQGRVCTLFTFKYMGKKTISVFPFGFPNKKPVLKNKIVNFITVGEIKRENRNFDLLFYTIHRLIAEGITNFRIHIIGNGYLKIPERLKKNIILHGRLNYPRMFNLLHKADFYLPLLDPYISLHQRYLTGTTTGSILLIMGFSIPPIINELFGKTYGFKSHNAILYKENNLTEAMIKAINVNNKKYKRFVNSLIEYKRKLYLKSLYNLKQMLKHISKVNKENLKKNDEKQLSIALMAKVNILKTEIKKLRRSLAIDDDSLLFKIKNTLAFNQKSEKKINLVVQRTNLSHEIDKLEKYKRKLITIKKILPILPLCVRLIDFILYIFSFLNRPIKKSIDQYSKNVVVLGVIPFEYRYQRPQHLASQIARNGWKIVYINTVFFSFPSVRLRKLRNNIIHIQLSLTGNPIITLELPNRKIINETVACLKQVVTPKTIFKIDHPFWSFIPDCFSNPVIYDCMDNHESFEVGNQRFKKLEKELVTKCTFVTASSDILTEKMKLYGAKHVVTLNNAGEYKHFAKAQNKYLTVPVDFRKMKGKIIGYYGAIAEWFDEKIILKLAEEFPQNSIVLIGQISHPSLELLTNKYRNIHLLGEKPYKDLPAYLQMFDVCLIPFVINNLTKATNPVKIYEYFAAGKPVVSTDLPELRDFKDVMYLAKSTDDFVKKVGLSLKENNKALVEKRQQIARNNTWEKRGEVLNRLISTIIKK